MPRANLLSALTQILVATMLMLSTTRCGPPGTERMVVIETVIVEEEVQAVATSTPEGVVEKTVEELDLDICADSTHLTRPVEPAEGFQPGHIEDPELGTIYFLTIPYENAYQQRFEVTVYGKSPDVIVEYLQNVEFCLVTVGEVLSTPETIPATPPEIPTEEPNQIGEFVKEILKRIFGESEDSVALKVEYTQPGFGPGPVPRDTAIKFNFDYTKGVSIRQGQIHAYIQARILSEVKVALQVDRGRIKVKIGEGFPTMGIIDEIEVSAEQGKINKRYDVSNKCLIEIHGQEGGGHYKLKGEWLVASHTIEG